MLPRATTERTPRERAGRQRAHAGDPAPDRPQRCGRRSTAFDFGEHTIRLDCDVLQADGGTRTAAVTGAAVALADGCAWLARSATA